MAGFTHSNVQLDIQNCDIVVGLYNWQRLVGDGGAKPRFFAGSDTLD